MGREATIGRDENDARASERRSLLAHGIGGGRALAAAGLGGALLALMARPAFADQTADVQMLQTATSIEIVAIATYDAALKLPFMGSLPKVVQTFATTTKQQHTEHMQAFSAAVRALGGKAQTAPDPVLLGVVNKAKPGLTGPGAARRARDHARDGRGGDLRRVRHDAVRQERAQHDREHHGSRSPARRSPERGQGARRGRASRIPHVAAPTRQVAGRRGQRRLPDSFYPYDAARPADEGAVK